MNTERDELAEIYVKTLNAGHGMISRHEQGMRAANKIIAAGYRKDQYLTDDQLYSGDGDTELPNDTFVESSDGSVWRVEPDFGWDCVSSGSATLSGPARLLVLGGEE